MNNLIKDTITAINYRLIDITKAINKQNELMEKLIDTLEKQTKG